MILGRRLQSVALRCRSPLVRRQPENWPERWGSNDRVPLGRWNRRDSVTQGPRPTDSLDRRSRLEAVLFLARDPLSVRKLAQLANLADGTETRTLVAALRKHYDERGAAFQVEQVAGGYQLLTRLKLAPWLRPLGIVEDEIRLTPPALETLAVVAYQQPVLRAEVEAIRGVACGELLRQLMDRDLVRIVGRSEELGRPLWYGTTKRFLRAFGLCSLDELPLASQLRRPLTRDETKCDENRDASDPLADLTADKEAA